MKENDHFCEDPPAWKEYDELTGLYTQEAFYKHLGELLEEKKQGDYYLLYVDIERFKLLNDLYGMAEGDRLLRWIGECIGRDCKKKGGIGCRIRADNFVLCAPYEEKELRYALWLTHNELKKYPINFEIVLNIGIYKIVDRTVPLSLMCDRALMAANTIKGNALAYYAYYQDNMRENLLREQEMVRDMRIALEKKQFEIYAQPKFNHANGYLVGLEALVRWNHPEKGIISPGYFIPVFEHNNFIQEVDRYVWENACRMIHEWIQMGKCPIPMSVNVSRINLYNPYLCEIFENLCDMYRIDKKLLPLEITESAFIEDTEIIADAVRRLRKAGFSILLDDFGSGFSSFHILKDLDFDQIKIDMKFLMGDYSHGKGKVILESIVKMAEALDISVIAEGVETKEQADFLLGIGCPYIQGYYYSRPLPQMKLEKMLDEYLRDGRVQFGEASIENSGTGMDSFCPADYEAVLSRLPGAAALYLVGDRVITLNINEKALDLTGYSMLEYDSAVRDDVLGIVYKRDAQLLWNRINHSIKEHTLINTSFRIVRKGGGIVWVTVWADLVGIYQGKPVFLAMFDISAEETNLVSMMEHARKYRYSLNSEAVSSAEIDLTGNRVITADGADLYNINESEQVSYSRYIQSIAVWVHPEEKEEFLTALNKETLLKSYYRGERLIKNEYQLLHHSKKQYVYVRMSIYFVPNMVNGHVYMDIFVHDITEQKKKELDLMAKAETDPLTGIYNRGAVEQKVNCLLEESKEDPEVKNVLFMIDVDDFKIINDTMGHRRGDQALIEIGRKLRRLFRKSDICGRMGGDEFVVFMTGVTCREIIVNKARQICEALQFTTGDVKADDASVSCSIGAAISPDDGQSFEDLFEKADQALYRAKRQGKNRYVIYGD